MRTSTKMSIAYFVQYLIGIVTVVAMPFTVYDTELQRLSLAGIVDRPLFPFVLVLILLYSNSYVVYRGTIKKNQEQQIETKRKLIGNISQVVFHLITKNTSTQEIDRILVLVRYRNTLRRRISLFLTALFSLRRIIEKNFYDDRFISISGYNHTVAITDGISFKEDSITKKAYTSSDTICEQVKDGLGSSKSNLQYVLSSPIILDGLPIGTLNVDSSKTDSFCSIANKEILQTFASVIADILGDDSEDYAPYISKRYKKFIVNAH